MSPSFRATRLIIGSTLTPRPESASADALAGSQHVMPVCMLQGTFSHEPPGTLRNFALMGTKHPVFVAERVQQVSFAKGSSSLRADPCSAPRS